MKKFINLSIAVISTIFISNICYAQITNKYALVIGIKGYPNYPSDHKLKYTDKDAILFANFLKSKEGGIFHSRNIILLTNENATKTKIINKINWLKSNVTYDNLVYIYFSGYGKVDENNHAYLMPYDADPKLPEDKGIRTDEFLQMIKDKIKVQCLISFIDACYAESTVNSNNSNGNSQSNMQDHKNIVKKYNEKWAQLFQNQDEIRLSFLSASPGEISYEHDDLSGGQGIFTYFLVEGLRGGADGILELDNVITVEELNRYVVTRVSRYAQSKLSASQHPICFPDLFTNYPMSIVNIVDFSSKKTVDFSRLIVRVMDNPYELNKLAEKVEKNIALILKGMNKRDVSSEAIRNACTLIGHKQLQNIITKTNPNPDRLFYPIRLLQTIDPNYFQVRDISVFIKKGNTYKVLPLCFKIKNPSGKIDELFFTSPPKKISDPQPDSDSLNPNVKDRILQFLSKYMTAYYVEDIDFIEKLFSDEALIIIGNVIRTIKTNAVIDEKIKYFIKTKPEYIESLKKVFAKDSFIKLEFNDIKMEKHQLTNFVGVTIRQLWYAEHYWDEGFLFLLFEYDIKEPDKFVLHVRAWQDGELDQGPLIGVHSVNFVPEIDSMQFSFKDKEDTVESKKDSVKAKDEDSAINKEDTSENKKNLTEAKEDSIESKKDSAKDKEDFEEKKKESAEGKEDSVENKKDSTKDKEEDSAKDKEDSEEKKKDSAEDKENSVESKKDSTKDKEEDSAKDKEDAVESKKESAQDKDEDSAEKKKDSTEDK